MKDVNDVEECAKRAIINVVYADLNKSQRPLADRYYQRIKYHDIKGLQHGEEKFSPNGFSDNIFYRFNGGRKIRRAAYSRALLERRIEETDMSVIPEQFQNISHFGNPYAVVAATS